MHDSSAQARKPPAPGQELQRAFDRGIAREQPSNHAGETWWAGCKQAGELIQPNGASGE